MTISNILANLSSSDIVSDLNIIDMNIEPPVQSLKAKAILKNGYVLQVTESIGTDFRRYSYHLQKGGVMIKRWDNAPHWKSVKTFPHHIHVQNSVKSMESPEVYIEDVLLDLENMLQ